MPDASLELGVRAVGVPPDRLLAIVPDLGHPLHLCFVDVVPRPRSGRS